MVSKYGMAPAPHEHTYEAWVIHEDHTQPAGVFDASADGRVSHAVAGDLADAIAIGVTIEPDGGSPQPSSEPLMRIELG